MPNKNNKVQIAEGNTKLGAVPAIALPPCIACRKDAPCKPQCYALKAWRQYKETRAAWSRNYRLATNNRADYFAQINSFITRKRPRFFRWHVAGDILDQNYLDSMITIADLNHGTKFLCFTKMYHLDFSKLPSNLTIVFSVWPKFSAAGLRKRMPKAYMLDLSSLDYRIPAAARECPGNCESCGACWNLQPTESVVFHKH